jgi:cysteine-rich repeat protein
VKRWSLAAVALLGACSDTVMVRNSLCSISSTCPEPLVPSLGMEDGGTICRCVTVDLAVCGNGRIEPGEACDDGNDTAGDGCVRCQVGNCAVGDSRDCGPLELNGRGLCRKGTQRCIGGQWESSCNGAVEPRTELCDSSMQDEDCDGMANEGCSCPTIGDSQPCCAARGTQTCQATPGGGSAWGQCSILGSAELCNGIDDDCDGTPDNLPPDGGTLCPVRGQVCSGSCNCPSGQAICGSTCVLLGTSCTSGLGACRRMGALNCLMTDGGPTVGCDALAGLPTTEVCNTIDDDCDGMVDEGTFIECLTDQDNDRHAANTTRSSQCPDVSRTAFGSCPFGFVAPASALSTTDCSDTSPGAFQLLQLRTDADADSWCVGTARTECSGAAPSVGTRLATACNMGPDDCNDMDPTRFVTLDVRTDVDGDGRCTGMPRSECSASVPAVGSRLTASCSMGADDCNDMDATRFQTLMVRADADGDSYCTGPTVPQCAGALPATGTRASCAGDDCLDTNSFVNTSCATRFLNGTRNLCPCAGPFGSMDCTTAQTLDCGPGWRPLGCNTDFFTLGGGPSTCSTPVNATGLTSITCGLVQRCNGGSGTSCRPDVDCVPCATTGCQ